MVQRLRAVLALRKRDFLYLIMRAQAIYNAISGNAALFNNPVWLVLLLSRIQALVLAQQAVRTGGKGLGAVRNQRAAEVVTSLETARTFIQELVDANPADGATLIEGAAMLIAKLPTYTKPILQARQVLPSSTVHLAANVGALTAATVGRIFFSWQSSSDNGKTWVTAPSTPHGETDILALTPGLTYVFRASVNDVNGPGVWTEVVTLPIH